MMPAITQNWNHPFDLFCRELDHVLAAPTPPNRLGSFPVDIRDETDAIILEAELPGFTKDQITVSTEDNVLSIAADREQPKSDTEADKPSHMCLRERRLPKASRSFRFPRSVDTSDIEAHLDAGVLTLRLPKRAEVKPRRIQVK